MLDIDANGSVGSATDKPVENIIFKLGDSEKLAPGRYVFSVEGIDMERCKDATPFHVVAVYNGEHTETQFETIKEDMKIEAAVIEVV